MWHPKYSKFFLHVWCRKWFVNFSTSKTQIACLIAKLTGAFDSKTEWVCFIKMTDCLALLNCFIGIPLKGFHLN